ncbi:MAG: CDP-alcohol phosphatidyltransferase family protein [Nitrospiraceae bacterium]|nr:CDP-alcohol phosphatidyltransferase family protein [Nitrospiraceae bacterium]
MLGERFGHFMDRYLAPAARNIPVSPNALTIAGFLITALAAWVMLSNLFAAGLLIVAGGIFDMLDGAVARVTGRESVFGALLDSTLDRFSDALLLLAGAWIFVQAGSSAGVFLSASALVFSFLVSYIRARAEGLLIQCRTGLMERPERIAVMAVGCLVDQLFVAVAVISILSAVTAMQRLLHVWRTISQRD